MIAKSNQVREGKQQVLRKKKKKKRFCFVIKFELIFGHPCFYVVCACTELFSEVGHFTNKN